MKIFPNLARTFTVDVSSEDNSLGLQVAARGERLASLDDLWLVKAEQT